MKLFKIVLTLLLLIILFFVNAGSSSAIVNPLDYSNNKFGIHILDSIDLEPAKELVNSSGGDWGYVTLVIQENDRDIKKWQKVFNEMRRLHLIPIVRIASRQENNGWKKLEIDDINSWIYFLNSLNWVIKNRYLIIGNEPNHAIEWGNDVNPQEYSNYFVEFSKRAKDASADFFIIPAALDASAPDNKEHLSEEKFIQEILASRADFYEFADGLASHSYPNPDFAGSEHDTGKGSVKTFAWELNLLKNLNISKNLPLFITETGWIHDDNGQLTKSGSFSTLSEKYNYAYSMVWNDPRIVAVTPFVLSYKDKPFKHFSWLKTDRSSFDFFESVKNLPKVKGEPIQEENGQILFLIAPKVAQKDSFTNALLLLKNTGQSIWESGQISLVEIVNNQVIYKIPINQTVEPEQKIYLSQKVFIPNIEGEVAGKIKFARGDRLFGGEYKFNILALKPLQSVYDYLGGIRQIVYHDPLNFLLNEFGNIFW